MGYRFVGGAGAVGVSVAEEIWGWAQGSQGPGLGPAVEEAHLVRAVSGGELKPEHSQQGCLWGGEGGVS